MALPYFEVEGKCIVYEKMKNANAAAYTRAKFHWVIKIYKERFKWTLKKLDEYVSLERMTSTTFGLNALHGQAMFTAFVKFNEQMCEISSK